MPKGHYPRKPKSMMDRFLAFVDRNGPGGCWNWTGSCGKGGYGQFGVNRIPYGAHRVSMMLFRDVPITRGRAMNVDHLCRNKRCVNPDHLEYVTFAENMRRSLPFRTYEAQRAAGKRRAERTHCLRGHAFDETNTYITPRGTRDCRMCRSEAWRRYQQKQGSVTKAVQS